MCFQLDFFDLIEFQFYWGRVVKDEYGYLDLVFFVVNFFDDIIEVGERIIDDMNGFVWFEQGFWFGFVVVIGYVMQDCISFMIGDWSWFVGSFVDEVYDMWGIFYQVLGIFVYFYLNQYIVREEFVFVFVFLVVLYFYYFFGGNQNFVEFFFYVSKFDMFDQ